MSRFFITIHTWFTTYPLRGWGITISIALVLGYMSMQIRLEEDITQLIPDSDAAALTQRVLETVSFSDKIAVHMHSPSGDASALSEYATQFIDSVATHLDTYVSRIQGRVSEDRMFEVYDFVYKQLPLFLTEADYTAIAHQLSPDSIAQVVERNYKTLLSPAGLVAKQFIVKDPLGITPKGLEKLAALQLGDDFELYDGFLVTKDHQHLLLFITPALPANETAQNTAFVAGLERITQQLNTDYAPRVQTQMVGATLYAVANATQIKKDIQLTIGIAMTILLLILAVFYRKWSIPLLIFVPTLFGALVGLTVLWWVKGTISAISLGIGAVLLGITLDYSLHILTHYRHTTAISALYKDVARPILMSSLTTAVAFLCLLFVQSDALNDLGVFAAVSVLAAAVAALVLIPQLARFSTAQTHTYSTWIDRIAKWPFDKNKWLQLGIGMACIVGLFLFRKVVFTTDLEAMNYKPPALAAAQNTLDSITNSKATAIYTVSYAAHLDAALQTNHVLHQQLVAAKAKGTLVHYSSVGEVVLSKAVQQQKMKRWYDFWTPERQEQLKASLIAAGTKVGFKPSTFTPFYEQLARSRSPIEYEDYSAIKGLHLDEFITVQEDFATVVAVAKVPKTAATTIETTLSQIPNTVQINRKQLNEALLGKLKNDFDTLISYSFIAVIILLLVFYRDSVLTLLTIIPIAITWIITLGVMQVLGIDFNIFNVIISTFIFGLGVDYSIFMTNGLLKEHTDGTSTLPTYKTAILLSMITTILGIGVLIFAQHPALRSIAVVSLVGILTAVLVSFVVQPILFRYAITYRSQKGKAPLQLRQTLWSVGSIAYFVIGGFLVSIISSVLIPWLPIKTKKKMHFFHKVVSKMMASVLYTNPFLKVRVDTISKDTFSKQAILIANHSSFLDILVIGMLHPKLIFLVKDWVYQSPIFGKAARLAGFYPVSSGIEDGVAHLQKKVAQGYSLIAFPEGSRTSTAKMRRFHKGAFYLAETLELDVLPIIIHGAAHAAPKGDSIIYDGQITLTLLPRITNTSFDFGTTYAARTKKISAYCKSQYIALQETLERGDYFKKAVLANYSYKTSYRAVQRYYTQYQEALETATLAIPADAQVGVFSDNHAVAVHYISYRRPYAKLHVYPIDTAQKKRLQNSYTVIKHAVAFVTESTIGSQKNDVLLLEITAPLAVSQHAQLFHDVVQKIIVLSEDTLIIAPLLADWEIEVQHSGVTVLNRKR